MGVAKEIARKGAIGATARWGAEVFFSYFAGHKFGEFSTDEELRAEIDKLVEYALKVRFQGDLSHKDAQLIHEMYMNSARVIGYSGFINSILAVEAGLYKNTRENIAMFNDVVEEELEKANVGPAIIYGEMMASAMHSSSKDKTQNSVRSVNTSEQGRKINILPWLIGFVVFVVIVDTLTR